MKERIYSLTSVLGQPLISAGPFLDKFALVFANAFALVESSHSEWATGVRVSGEADYLSPINTAILPEVARDLRALGIWDDLDLSAWQEKMRLKAERDVRHLETVERAEYLRLKAKYGND